MAEQIPHQSEVFEIEQPDERPAQSPGCFDRLVKRVKACTKKVRDFVRNFRDNEGRPIYSSSRIVDLTEDQKPDGSGPAAEPANEPTLRGEGPVVVVPCENEGLSNTVVYQDRTNPQDVICQIGPNE